MSYMYLIFAGECMDEVTILSPYVVNGQQSVCGSACMSPLISIGSIEIKYGSSQCCHNYGFRFISFCSSPIDQEGKKKRAAPEVSLTYVTGSTWSSMSFAHRNHVQTGRASTFPWMGSCSILTELFMWLSHHKKKLWNTERYIFSS